MLNYLHISKKMRTFAPAKCALGPRRALTECTRWGERRQWSHLRFSMENCLELAIRTEGAVGSVAPTIEQGIVLAIYLPNATRTFALDLKKSAGYTLVNIGKYRAASV